MKQPTGGALRAPLAGSPACVFVFVFVLIYVEFEFSPPSHPPAPVPRSEQNYINSRKSILKIQIQYNYIKRKTKRKTQRVKQPFAPPSQVPPLAFLFSFSFWFTLNLNFPHPPVPVPRRENKNHEKNEVWLKWKFRSWRSILFKNHQNWSYPKVSLAI